MNRKAPRLTHKNRVQRAVGPEEQDGGKEINSIYCTLVGEAGWLFILD